MFYFSSRYACNCVGDRQVSCYVHAYMRTGHAGVHRSSPVAWATGPGRGGHNGVLPPPSATRVTRTGIVRPVFVYTGFTFHRLKNRTVIHVKITAAILLKHVQPNGAPPPVGPRRGYRTSKPRSVRRYPRRRYKKSDVRFFFFLPFAEFDPRAELQCRVP